MKRFMLIKDRAPKRRLIRTPNRDLKNNKALIT